MKITSTYSLALTLAVVTLAAAGCDQQAQPTLSTLAGPSATPASVVGDVSKTSAEAATLVSRRTPTKVVNEKLDVPYFDADFFDAKLSGSMAKNPAEIYVDVETPVSQVPARVNSWFTQVADRGGQVNMLTEDAWAKLNAQPSADGLQTRGFFLIELLPFLFTMIKDHIHEAATYGPASNYDAFVVTNNQKDHIQKVVFRHKDIQ